ncbi:Lumazine-binding protein [Marasmius fiardii PR-910]|nr:Lumazine-binding protein [Marasmius fiardii PR-910]
MFTGLIERLGTVSHIEVDSQGCTMIISNAAPILDDCHIGDSIATNGVCLTVTEFNCEENGGWFKVWLANETLERSDLERKVGERVNLERAMGSHTRFGGHFVQGHVDGTATIISRTADGDSLRLVFRLSESKTSLLPYIIEKGYVAIDGTSLTITEVNDEEKTFGIMLIQHTQEKITLGMKAVGAKVNIEVDMVGKYVEKGVLAAMSGSGGSTMRVMVEKIVEDVLARKGLA